MGYSRVVKNPPIKPHAYDLEHDIGGPLIIHIREEFDAGKLHRDWAPNIIARYPGPHPQVRIELSRCGSVSSTFFAGLIQLHHAYNKGGTTPLVLVKPDPRLVRNLAVLHFESLFTIEPR